MKICCVKAIAHTEQKHIVCPVCYRKWYWSAQENFWYPIDHWQNYTQMNPDNTMQKPTATTHDPVNHPAHYTSDPSGVECITITRHRNFNIGNAIKCLWRAGLKSADTNIQDLKKAVWYIQDEIGRLEDVKLSERISGQTHPPIPSLANHGCCCDQCGRFVSNFERRFAYATTEGISKQLCIKCHELKNAEKLTP